MKTNTNTSTNPNTEVETTIVTSDEKIESTPDKAKRLYEVIKSGRKASLKLKIEFAKFLLDSKKELKNKFYTEITEDIISKKQVGRFIKLILTKEAVTNFATGMSHKYKDAKKIEENLALLVEDTRVTSLTVEDIETMIEPIEATIYTAKLAETDEDFLLAIKSDENVLKAIKDKKSDASKAKKDNAKKKADDAMAKQQEEIAKNRPVNMDVDRYDSLLKEDKTTLINILQEQIDEANALREELADLRELAEKAKYYDKQITEKAS